MSPRSVSTAASERPAIFGAYASRDDVPSYAAAFDEMFDELARRLGLDGV